MRRIFLASLIGMLISTLAFGVDIKSQIGTQDLNMDADNQPHGTFQRRISTSGSITLDKIDGNQIPWSSAYTGNIRPHDITGHSASPGRIQNFSIGSSSYTDNGYFGDVVTKGPYVDVRTYLPAGYVTDGSVDYTTYFHNAVDNAADGSTIMIPANFTLKVTDGKYVEKSISIKGHGANSRIIQYGTSWPTSSVLLHYRSPITTTFTASGSLAAGDTTLTLNDNTGLAVGTEVFLQLGEAKYDPTQPYVAMFNTIASISGDNVTFRVPFPETINGTSHKCLLLTRIVQGVTVSDLSLEADSAAQPDQAMYIERCRNVTVKNVTMNHTGSLINAQSENVTMENIYIKRARRYGSYGASGNAVGGWGFRNFTIKNLFVEDADNNGVYFEAEGRGATIENFVYNAGSSYVTSNHFGINVTGDCKGIYIKNYHFNAPQQNYIWALNVGEGSEIRTEDVFIYNGGNNFSMKYHSGIIGWDRDTGTMEYYRASKLWSTVIKLTNSMNRSVTLPGGIYKSVKAFTNSASDVTQLNFATSGGDHYDHLQTDNTVELPSDLTTLGSAATYPFNNTLAKSVTIGTDNSVAANAYLTLLIDYYPSDVDAVYGKIQNNESPINITSISGTGSMGNNLRGTATILDNTSSVAVSFSTNEPDTSYFLAFSKDGADDIWFSNKATTGFTINRTGTTGARIVNWVLIR